MIKKWGAAATVAALGLLLTATPAQATAGGGDSTMRPAHQGVRTTIGDPARRPAHEGV